MGTPTPATTRGDTWANCPKTPKPLTALLANNGSDFTLSEYPTFWFYIPYAPERIGYMEFLLLDVEDVGQARNYPDLHSHQSSVCSKSREKLPLVLQSLL